jgi:hypothetical protein
MSFQECLAMHNIITIFLKKKWMVRIVSTKAVGHGVHFTAGDVV